MNIQDGNISVHVDFFRRLRREGRLVFLCLNPNQRDRRDFMREICERYMFAFHGRGSPPPDFASLIADQRVRSCMGHLIDA